MKAFAKIAAWLGTKAANYLGATFTLTDTGPWRMLNSGSVTGKRVDDTTAMQVTAFFAGVRLLAETMGAMPSSVFLEEKSGNSVKADDHPLNEVLVHQPNADMNGVEFREANTSNLAARGNAYCLIETRSNGEVSSLYPIPASQVQVKRDSSTGYEIKYGVRDRGTMEWYPAEKIWHRKGFSFDGLVGLSPIGCAREAIGLALAGEEFNARLFGQGLMPSARISIPAWLTDEQRKIANAKLLEMHTGLENMGKPMLLEGGMTVQDGLLSPDDAQFLQLRQFTVVEICRLLGIKPHMIAALERATDNNIERLSLEFVMYTMLPHMRRDEVAIRKLFRPSDRNKYFYRYNFEGLLRADSVSRANLYSILLQNGVFSRNEVRALENRNQIADPAMDQYTVQSNMAMIDQLAAIVAARQAPAAPAAPPQPAKAADVQNFSFHLPSEMKHQVEQAIEFPGIQELASEVRKNGNRTAAVVKSFERAVADVKNAVARPRRLILDDAGNPIGSEVVGNAEVGGHKASEKSDFDPDVPFPLDSELAAEVRKNGELTAAVVKSFEKSVADLKMAIDKPRRLKMDKDGNPIGSESVETLH